ncbi:MAG: DUF1428 family protein [Saprospiraceae bacterium]|nr:DUF1428 family protein [Saprospiraceae bacterium]
MTNYIDGFVLPIPKQHLEVYQRAAAQIAEIWKEHGALAYVECVGDDLELAGTRSFVELVDATEDEVVIFGWTVFPSREVRDRANAQVPGDPRMANIVAPLTDPARLIFDAARMVFGGFRPIVESGSHERT